MLEIQIDANRVERGVRNGGMIFRTNNGAEVLNKFWEEREMYIAEKYWNNYIGDTDDSLTLVEYLAEKQKEGISLGEIFADFGLDHMQGEFRKPEVPLVFENSEGEEVEIHYAIDLITDLAALLLECRVSGSVNLCELFGFDLETSVPDVCITASAEEHELMNKVLKDFAADPLAYDLSEMVPEEDMMEMARLCEELRQELYA